MKDEHRSAALARRITWKGSKQFSLIALLLADRDRTDDCFRAYGYFRWADDVIDLVLPSDEARCAFAKRQQELIRRFYDGERPDGLCAEEAILADLIAHDREPGSGLRSFIEQFLWVLAFDACRSGRAIRQADLDAYTDRLASAVMDGIQYFIGRGHPYARPPERTRAVVGAHLTHMLRDLREDLPRGIVNIPQESLDAHGIDIADPGGEPLCAWVRGQTDEARRAFREGRRYIDSLAVLRCKLAGIWYCARFERVLDAIERDGYRLRATYQDRGRLSTWIDMIRLTARTAAGHWLARAAAAVRQGDPEETRRTNIPIENI